MKKDYTHISLVLDRSGSMDSVKADTIGSFNTFLKEQKENPKECTFTLVQFDNEYEIIHDFVSLKKSKNLTEKTFVPRGMTALYDAIGRTINSVGQKLEAMNEEDRPERVIFVVLTDGEENSSKEFHRDQINEMIKHQTEKYNWQFIYLGANQDAISAAGSIGIKSSNAMTFACNARGISATATSLSASISNYRNVSSVYYSEASATMEAFTDEDRKKQEDILKSSITTSNTL